MLKTVKNIDIKIAGLNIIKKIGDGGMSVVYLAEQISLKREVAVKVMRLEIASNDMDVQRFKHEAKTIAQLDHPNIINIYNIGQTAKGEIFFTMPYLNHGDFSSYILEDEQEFVKLLKSICDGLSFAHDRGVIHRDIKPENLLFDKFGNVRIADFGIAISKDGTRMTKEHQIVGSAQYMSPEQARSLKVDVHSDIYSLGIVIYERLTGKVPFDSEESISILVNHVSMDPPKLPVKMRHWQKLIDKCLAKAPRDRFQSMVELKIALNNIPSNPLQRTNNSIIQLLENDKGKHLKWFVPSLLILIIIAVFGFNKPEQIVDKNSITIAKPPIQDGITTPSNELNPIDTSTSEEKTPENIDDFTTNIVSQNGFENETTAKIDKQSIDTNNQPHDLSIEEIKDKFKQEFPESNTNITKNSEETTEIDENLNPEIKSLLTQAKININKYQLSKPANNNATEQLLRVLSLEPENQQAVQELHNVGKKYYQLVDSALNKEDFNTALKHTNSFLAFNKKSNAINSKFKIQKNTILNKIKQLSLKSLKYSVEQVQTIKKIVASFSPQSPYLIELDKIVRLKRGPQPGDKLLDERGIETVIINPKLAVTTNEITVEQYKEFANIIHRPISRCRHLGGGVGSFFNSKNWQKPYFPQTSKHPVVCISQLDAKAYSQWLSKETGNRYRLPTKNEWLTLAATDKNSFIPCKTGNVTGKEAIKIRNKENKYSCTDNYKFTAPVGSFTKNKWGINDIQGNVSEWISCQYSACQSPTAMGSSWYNGKKSNIPDKSASYKQSMGYSYIGFRLARDL